jgi:hypothetical protein
VLADGSGVWFQRRTAPAPSPAPGSSEARPALVVGVLISRPRDGGEGFELHHSHVIGGRAVQVPALQQQARTQARMRARSPPPPSAPFPPHTDTLVLLIQHRRQRSTKQTRAKQAHKSIHGSILQADG